MSKEKVGIEKIREQEKEIEARMEKIRHKIMVISGKGGVGKTTVAVNLAVSIGMLERRVGLLDADIHGPNVPKMLGIEDMKPNVSSDGIIPVIVPPGIKVMSIGFLLSSKDSAVIWRGPLKMGAIRQFLSDVVWGELDYLVIDLPPGTGDEPLSVAQLIKNVDGAIIVTTPQDVALLDSRKAVTFARQLGIPVIGIIENMSTFVCPHCGKEVNIFKYGGGERAAMELGVPFLGRLPLDVEVVEASDGGKPFVLREDSKAVASFRGIVEGVMKFVGEP
ncbi:MAG: Mrp/NBP35 family ATP-binding protein [Candidatus Methanospirareceae archaeon]